MARKPINFKKAIDAWADKYSIDINVDELLSKSMGKEEKLCLRLAKQHNKPNALNSIFVSRLSTIDPTNYQALTKLYLSVFFPSDLNEVDNLMKRFKGKENELILKLQSNFNASAAIDPSSEVDYHMILTAFLKDIDPKRIYEVDPILEKCKGREAILFAVLAKEYKASNPLNKVFISRMKSQSMDELDYYALTKLYLSIFNPRITHRTNALLSQYQGKEFQLFSKLSDKFYAVNPLKLSKNTDDPKTPVESIDGSADSKTSCVPHAQQCPGIVA